MVFVGLFFDFCESLTKQQCIEMFRSTFDNEAPSKNTMYNWFVEL